MSDKLVCPLEEEELFSLAFDTHCSISPSFSLQAPPPTSPSPPSQISSTRIFQSKPDDVDQPVLEILNDLFQQGMNHLCNQDSSAPTQIHSTIVQQEENGIIRCHYLCYKSNELLASLPFLPRGKIYSFLTHSYLQCNPSASSFSRFQFIYHLQPTMSGVFFFRESLSQERVTFNNDILTTRPNGTSASFCRGFEKIRPVGMPQPQHGPWRFYLFEELAQLFQQKPEFNHVFGFYPIHPAFSVYVQTTILQGQNHTDDCCINAYAGIDLVHPQEHDTDSAKFFSLVLYSKNKQTTSLFLAPPVNY